MQRPGVFRVRSSLAAGAMFIIALVSAGIARGQTVYDATAAYEAGWIAQTNPNGLWSYGYSSGPTAPVSLYTTPTTGSLNGGNEQFWLTPAVDDGYSPSVALNNGPAYNDGYIDYLADELVIADGAGGQYSNILFSAPASSLYSLDCSFRGDQLGVGTVVAVAAGGNVIFNSTVTEEEQVDPFDTDIYLNAGETVDFSVGPDGGNQNTGFSATFTTVPEPASLSLLVLAAPMLMGRRRRN
jgi:hypothetical protein